MTATIVSLEDRSERRAREQRLMELVRDLSGVPTSEAEAAFQCAPPPPTEPLERVAHALVQLRRNGGLRIARYVARETVATTRNADVVPLPTLGAGPMWRRSVRPQLMRSAIKSATSASMQPTGSPKDRSTP
ncbi:MAG TPA: hypothetical protein VF183_03275 [Acidimicrobiales bacterium]